MIALNCPYCGMKHMTDADKPLFKNGIAGYKADIERMIISCDCGNRFEIVNDRDCLFVEKIRK